MKAKLIQNFHDDGIPKEYSHCICVSVILIASVFKIDKNYFPQFFWKNVNTLSKKKRLANSFVMT